jgi:hypothetical protein
LTLEGTITNGVLEQHFENNDVIRLVTGTTVVNGTVDAGKVLEIAGNVAIADLLVIKGRVDILETGRLDATGGEPRIEGGSLGIDGDLVVAWAAAEEAFEDGIPAGVSFGPNGAIDLGLGGSADNVDYLFSKGVPAVVSSAIGLRENEIAVTTNWVGGRRLILSGPDVTTVGDVDLSGKGVLVIRNNLILDTTPPYQHTLRSSGSGGIIIAKTGELRLNESVLPTTIPIKVNGILSTHKSVTTKTIPANVDLSTGTLAPGLVAAPTTHSTFTFGPRAVAIGRIDLRNEVPLIIAGEANGDLSSIVPLTIKTITNTATGVDTSLTLPPGASGVERIIPPTGQTLTISGREHTTLSPLAISVAAGAANSIVRLEGDLVLRGRVELTPAAELSITKNSNLGSDNAAQLAQLASIIGGRVRAEGLHFDLTGGTYYTSLFTTGDLRVSGEVTFGAFGAAALTIEARSLYALDDSAVISGPSRIELEGDLIVSDTITINNSGGLTLPAATTSIESIIADGKSLIVGPKGRITMGNALVLGEGAYTAIGQVIINPNAGTITVGANLGDGLSITPTVGDTVNGITLLAGAVKATDFPVFTFAASAGVVVPVNLSGTGITVPRGTTGGSITVSGTLPSGATPGAVTVKGSARIALEDHGTPANKARLVLMNGALLGSPADTNPYTAAYDHYDSSPSPANDPRVYDTLGELWAAGTSPDKVIITPHYDDATRVGVFTGSTVKAP